MNTRWVKALLVIVMVAGSVVFAPPVAAQKGSRGLPPAGSYHFSSASVSFSSFANNMQIYLNVSANTDVSQPIGAPPTTSSATQISLNLFDYGSGTFTNACLLLDKPSDFTIDTGLAAATLTTTLSPATRSCPFSSPLTTSIGISATWTGGGPISTTDDESSLQCGTYRLESVGRNLSNLGTANLTLTLGSVSTNFSSSRTGLNSNDLRMEAEGVADPGCAPAGVGTGPVPAGDYHNFGLTGSAFFGMPPGPTGQISFSENNKTFHPEGGPAGTSSEFDLNLNLFGGSFNGLGCWAISPADVTSTGLTSASMTTTITATTPKCSNSYPFGINYPLTVKVVWTGTGPLVKVRDGNTYKCLGYTLSNENSVQSNTATSTATVTMPDYFGKTMTLSLTGGQGSLTNIDQRIEAEGVLQPACMIRA
jgi:hypothetical protein